MKSHFLIYPHMKYPSHLSVRCSACVAWDFEGDGNNGKCRLHPPINGEWPNTDRSDWCLDGIAIASAFVGSEDLAGRFDRGRVGFNYRYILDNPERSLTWLQCVFDRPSMIPLNILPLFVFFPQVGRTEALQWDDCEGLFKWAIAIEGGNDPEEADADRYCILTFLDEPEAVVSNSTALQMMGSAHAWRVLCSEFSARHIQALTQAEIQVAGAIEPAQRAVSLK